MNNPYPMGPSARALFATVAGNEREPTPTEVKQKLNEVDGRLGFVEEEVKILQQKERARKAREAEKK